MIMIMIMIIIILENCECGAFIHPSNPVGGALYLLPFFSRVLRKPISNNKMDRCCKKYQDFFTIVCPSRNSCRNAVAYNSCNNQVDNSEFKKIRRQLQRKRYIKIDLCVRVSDLRLFNVGHVVPNRRSPLSLT